MNALPEQIESMYYWYLWMNKINQLNKQYHVVFLTKCVKYHYDQYEISISNKNNAFCVFNYRFLNEKDRLEFFPYADARMKNIYSWKFDVQANKYIFKHRKEGIKIPPNYFYTTNIRLESTL